MRLIFKVMALCALNVQLHAQFVVTTTNDSGAGSLRQAIVAVNSSGGGTIWLSNVVGTITLTNGELLVNTNLNIFGPGSAMLTISGNSSSRIFNIQSNATVAISGLTIQGGSVVGVNGGAIINFGNLSLCNCVLNTNSAVEAYAYNTGSGGAIYNSGVITVTNSSLINNYASSGGGIYNAGVMTLDRCLVGGNICAEGFQDVNAGLSGGSGGGIYNDNLASMIHCTVTNNRSGNGGSGNPNSAGGGGGGVYNAANMVMKFCSVRGNFTGNGGNGGGLYNYNQTIGFAGGFGGGLWNGGKLMLYQCTFGNNACGNGGVGGIGQGGGNGGLGGGIFNQGSLSATNSVFFNNAGGVGGNGGPPLGGFGEHNGGNGGLGGAGGAVFSAGTLTLTDCTISGNFAGGGGDGIGLNAYGGNGGMGGSGGGICFNGEGTSLIFSCTIAANVGGAGGAGGTGYVSSGSTGSAGSGGGIYCNTLLQALNTIIANNTSSTNAQDVNGSFVSLGFNLVGNTNGSSGFGVPTDLIGVDPMVAPLADNGGPTLTMALLPGSPAIDQGTSDGLATDQRGMPRPQIVPGIPKAFDGSDIGAYEIYKNTNNPAYIAQQPASVIVQAGQGACFDVVGLGNPTMSYQWRFGGTNLPASTNRNLVLTNLTLAQAGNYDAVVANASGSVTSSPANLDVRFILVSVNGQPAAATMTAVASATVSISGGYSNGFLFYTLDGSVPTASSMLYEGPFTLTNAALVQVMGLSADFSQTTFAPAVTVQVIPVYTLQTSVSGTGNVTANPSSSPYPSNSVVTLTATPGTNWLFDHWAGDATGTQNPVAVTMKGPRNVQAVFVAIPFYAINTSDVGSGTISVNPPTGPYISNSVVTVTANASVGWQLDHWAGDAGGNQNPTTVTMNGPRSVQAVFVQSAFPLTVNTPGGGGVTANGLVIAPATYYSNGSVVTLAATAGSGWSFLGWQGDAGGTNNPLSVTINQANNIQAIFGTLVGTNTPGGGTIILSQQNPVAYGTPLTASASPSAGKYFVLWSGAASGTNSPATITVTNANPAVNALFATLPMGKYSLSLVVNGNGSVGISPQQNYYSPGDSVVLNAFTTNVGTSFSGWSGDASGTSSSLLVVMNTNKLVQANFIAWQLSGMTMNDGRFKFMLNGLPGAVYILQASPNLFDWTAISTNVIPVAGWISLVDLTGSNQSQRYYRVSPGP